MLGLLRPTPALATQALADFFPLCTNGMVREDAKEKGHLNGWGIAGYENGRPVSFARQPVPASSDKNSWEKAVERASGAGSPALLAHFRKASVGDQNVENTHPFQQDEWIFCHNGTLKDHAKLALKHLKPRGQTDSERLFLHLLESIDGVSAAERKPALQKTLGDIQKNFAYNSLTFLMSDGAALYAYRSYTEEERYYTLFTAESGGARLVCSEPILRDTIPSWTPLSKNQLEVFYV
jgi:predicted glutamine amidotransferase